MSFTQPGVNGIVYFVNGIRYEREGSVREDDRMGQNLEIEGKRLEIVKYAFDPF